MFEFIGQCLEKGKVLMYGNMTKSTWRGWAWNQLSRRLVKKRRVCVLAGDIAGDLPHAKKHKAECIAVDFNQECVDLFRSNGGVAIRDTLQNQIVSIQPNGLIADLVSGVSASTLGMMIDACMVCDAVVFNFLRGRDKGMGFFEGTIPEFRGRERRLVPVEKHRGMIATWYMAVHFANMRFGVSVDERFVPFEIFNDLRPTYYSYKSKDSGQYFDSVAISTTNMNAVMETKEFAKNLIPIASRRKTAAAKAVLSRRSQ